MVAATTITEDREKGAALAWPPHCSEHASITDNEEVSRVLRIDLPVES